MGMFSTAPALAGSRFRDDYGAVMSTLAYQPTSCRNLRSFPVVQPSQVVAVGGLNDVA
ncbi:hypothetical protein L579_2333 [Pantoea sp. AS-PWVM4]|uniref:Uncharacterized protein n=1 Tax=Pantoea phytobeneficialis TaxID=2052056 RepID=A0ABT8XQS2_9GAMM|nr:hypothetical protein [Pantoea sp. AS-PWVM4]ERK07404.1 hypothetical protein L579_2333 [Pantoea sp. AS-PWVM4]MDO6405290.1 hypothetical protein [Pantoea phytobeneficialis]